MYYLNHAQNYMSLNLQIKCMYKPVTYHNIVLVGTVPCTHHHASYSIKVVFVLLEKFHMIMYNSAYMLQCCF